MQQLKGNAENDIGITVIETVARRQAAGSLTLET
jgi:hypothetical protein